MAIQDSELLWYRSKVFNDDANNGGAFSYSLIESNQSNNVWPNIFKMERVMGSTKYRKVYGKVHSVSNEVLFNSQFWVDTLTPGDDWVVIFSGASIATQTDITGNERCYGCGKLNTDIAAASATMLVDLENSSLKVSGSDPIFAPNDIIRITDKVDPASAGNEEFHQIDTVVDVPSLNRVTITTKSPLKNSYTAASTRIMSVLDMGNLSGSVSNIVPTGSGTLNTSANPITVTNMGSTSENWTLTFVDATHIDIVGSESGAVASNVIITSDIAPTNPNVPTKTFFNLPAAAFSGTWTAGNTITFTTTAPIAAIWEKRIVPAGAASINNSTTVVFTGETVA